MPTPKSKNNLQRLLGMITFLGKLIPNLSVTTTPLRKLIESDAEWHWSNYHNDALDQIKKLSTERPTLRYYEPELPTKTLVDASNLGWEWSYFKSMATLGHQLHMPADHQVSQEKTMSKSRRMNWQFCLAVKVSMSTCTENPSLLSLNINRFSPY